HRAAIATALGQGTRVIAPDLIGFGKSDQPKRQALHTLAFHRDSLLQLMQRLRVDQARLIVPACLKTLGQALFEQGTVYFTNLEVLPEDLSALSTDDVLELDAPYPNAGHRAGERAFAAAIAN
ncbi:MAG: tRNA adenosine(34) deaminase TadA, partial [Rhodoferax sp.]|nr:tRNA adenosine(34) deaminase TadA [Rhodoferax sp.]